MDLCYRCFPQRLIRALQRRELVIRQYSWKLELLVTQRLDPAQQVQALAHELAARIEDAELHARLHQGGDERRGQIVRSEPVHQHVHIHAPLRCAEQCRMQLPADLVVPQNEGFQHHLALGARDGLEHAGKEVLAIFQQFEVVPRNPAGRARRPEAARHSRISAASGAWSDSLFQGFLGICMGECTAALRT